VVAAPDAGAVTAEYVDPLDDIDCHPHRSMTVAATTAT
jgi:hypothetical protein